MTDRPSFSRLRAARDAGVAAGVVSVCSAHPVVIEAALRQAWRDGGEALIEATCNQVNQDGGYTGMTPAGFAEFVDGIADRAGLPRGRVVLGGDHLGPNPWRHLDAGAAMAKAEAMVAAYTAAGARKLHLDASMGCAGEAVALSDDVTAARAARLARVAEDIARRAGLPPPRYVIGTEVPTPGGAAEVIAHLRLTTPEAAERTWAVHREAFAREGVEAALERVVAMVVQPGVEFGHANVAFYDSAAAQPLSRALDALPGLVFEAHSTDYQPPGCLRALVRDGFAILKVGPALTFALREALYALDRIAGALDPEWEAQSLMAAMERAMLDDPAHWRSHYHGGEGAARVLRHFSYSDRIRYYWPKPAAEAAVARLLSRVAIPETLASQFLPRLYGRLVSGALPPTPQAVLGAAVSDVLQDYAAACREAR